MLLELVREAIERGVNNLTLEVRASNTEAQSLYRRFGFIPVGVRRGYYREDGEDAMIMWATGIREPDYLDRLAFIEHRTFVPFPWKLIGGGEGGEGEGCGGPGGGVT